MDSNLFVFTETISSNGDINFAENVVIDGALFVCLSSATGISQHAPQLQTVFLLFFFSFLYNIWMLLFYCMSPFPLIYCIVLNRSVFLRRWLLLFLIILFLLCFSGRRLAGKTFSLQGSSDETPLGFPRSIAIPHFHIMPKIKLAASFFFRTRVIYCLLM